MDEKIYSEQPCAFCKVLAETELEECPACGGKTALMVKEPPKVCQFCKGNGFVITGQPCRICKGSGWLGIKRN